MKEKSFKTSFLDQEIDVHYLRSPKNAEFALSRLATKNVLFGLDIETMAKPAYRHLWNAALSPHLGDIRLIQVFDGRSIVVFDLMYCMNDQVHSLFTKFLQSNRFIAHNGVFEFQYLRKNFGVKLNTHCSMLMAKILIHATKSHDGGVSLSLEAATKGFLGVDLPKDVQNSKWGEPDLTFEQISYAALDAAATLRLGEYFAPYIEKYKLERYYKLIKEAQYPIVEMMLRGLKFDEDGHIPLIEEWGRKLFISRNNLMQMTGLAKITAYSMAKYLETHLDRETLSIWPRTDTGKLQTDADAFTHFSYLKIVKPFREFQKLDKMTSSFGENLLKTINPETKRIHPSFKICGARTGRLSMSNPNCQQMPRGHELRDLFIATEGNCILRADYNQIEVRVAGELSRDPFILNAYRTGSDIHRLTASKIMNRPVKQVTDDQRQQAKAVVFGSLYGIGAKKLSLYAKKNYDAEIKESDASDILKEFKATYAGYIEWAAKTREYAKTRFLTSTVLGKRRKLDEINWYGAAPNTWIQGTSAEIMLQALIRIQDRIDRMGLRGGLVNNVHDEVLVEAPLEEAMAFRGLIQEEMTAAFLDIFPQGITTGLVDKVTAGKNWGEAKG